MLEKLLQEFSVGQESPSYAELAPVTPVTANKVMCQIKKLPTAHRLLGIVYIYIHKYSLIDDIAAIGVRG